ncbi:MAG: TolB family protein [Anaerolineae bacterium]
MTDISAGRRQTIADLTWNSDYSVVGVFPSPDRRYIALSLQGYEGDTPLWLVNADGTGARFLMIGVFIGWAPDSTKIYVNRIGGRVGIQEVSIIAGTSRYLIEEYAIDPALSPDGQKIAFSSFQSGPGKSWILGISDLSKSAITKTSYFANSEFAWSPDSRKLAFTVLGRDDTNFYHAGELWMVDSDGKNPVRLSKEGEQDFDPDWSPDGRMLAYAHREAASDEASMEDPMNIVSSIWILDPVGQIRESVIGANGVGNMAPQWSPDSNKIAYIAKRGASSEIYLWDAVNGTMEQISAGPISITGGRHAPLNWVQ